MTTSVPDGTGAQPAACGGGHRAAPADRAVRVGELDVHRLALVVERLRPAGGPVHELVRDGQRARPVGRGQRAHGAGREHLPDADGAQRPQVRAVRDAVRREPVITAVPRHERHPPAGHLADDQRVARRAERGLDRYLVGGVQELVQPGPPMTPMLARSATAGQATFEPDEDEDEEEDDGRGAAADLLRGLLVALAGLVPRRVRARRAVRTSWRRSRSPRPWPGSSFCAARLSVR